MGYWNGQQRGGYYDRRGGGGYDRRGYDNRGYDRGPSYSGPDFDKFHNPNSKFDIGQKVIHNATGIELSIISFGREQIECRKPDLDTIWVYEHEISPMDGK